MDSDTKRKIMIAVIVVCFGSAGAITYIYNRGDSGKMPADFASELMWVKCNNPACKIEYQVTRKEYYEYLKEHVVDPMVTPPLVCKECGEESVYEAVKCGNPDCGKVFFKDSVEGGDPDTCPHCGHSNTEALKEEILARRRGEQ